MMFKVQLRQEPARLEYVNPKYLSNFVITTGRKGRGMPYVTNMTYELLLPWYNNVTGIFNFKDLNTKNSLTISYKACDILPVPWFKKYLNSILIDAPTKCPIRAIHYNLINMGVPDDLPFRLLPSDYEVQLLFIKTRSREKILVITSILRHEKGLQ